MQKAAYPIKVVVQRTGLNAHVIRVWERRHQVVEPLRTATNRRTYSDADIERLRLLGQLTQKGHAISSLASLGGDELQRLLANTPDSENTAAPADSDTVIKQCLEATSRLDATTLEGLLKNAELSLGGQGVLLQVIAPLANALGEQWRQGVLSAAHEHFASAVLRTMLGQTIRQSPAAGRAPVIVVATPCGQIHEIGALIVGALASNLGWRVLYLGANLPAAEIAGAAKQHQAKLVGLSIVYPEDDTLLSDELARLRDLLPAETGIVTGGRASPAYAPALKSICAMHLENLHDLGVYLDKLRRPDRALD